MDAIKVVNDAIRKDSMMSVIPAFDNKIQDTIFNVFNDNNNMMKSQLIFKVNDSNM